MNQQPAGLRGHNAKYIGPECAYAIIGQTSHLAAFLLYPCAHDTPRQCCLCNSENWPLPFLKQNYSLKTCTRNTKGYVFNHITCKCSQKLHFLAHRHLISVGTCRSFALNSPKSVSTCKEIAVRLQSLTSRCSISAFRMFLQRTLHTQTPVWVFACVCFL